MALAPAGRQPASHSNCSTSAQSASPCASLRSSRRSKWSRSQEGPQVEPQPGGSSSSGGRYLQMPVSETVGGHCGVVLLQHRGPLSSAMYTNRRTFVQKGIIHNSFVVSQGVPYCRLSERSAFSTMVVASLQCSTCFKDFCLGHHCSRALHSFVVLV